MQISFIKIMSVIGISVILICEEIKHKLYVVPRMSQIRITKKKKKQFSSEFFCIVVT